MPRWIGGQPGTVKPAAGTRVVSGPLTTGLRVLYPFWEGGGRPRSVVGPGIPPATLTGGQWGNNSKTIIRVHTAVTDVTSLSPDSTQIIPTGNVTIALGYRKRDSTLRDGGAFGTWTAVDAERCGVHLPYSDGTLYFDFGGSANGITRLSIPSLTFGDDFWVFTVGPRGMEVYQNAILRGSNVTNPTRTANAATEFTLGIHDGAQGDVSDYEYFAVWWRQLAVAEILSLSRAPYQMFAPPVWQTWPMQAALMPRKSQVPNIGALLAAG